MSRRFFILLLCLTAFISGACAQANQEEQARMRREIDELKLGQQRILEQLRELRGEPIPKTISPAKLQTPFDLPVDAESPETKGSKGARLAIVEFSDFQCSYCLSYVTETFPQIDKGYVRPGKVKYFFRNFPLTSGHPNAFRAAEAARCAAEQGKFWEAHDRFFAHQNELNPDDWPAHARALGLDAGKFDQCLMSGKYDAEINHDLDEAQRLGINGTPAFLIGVLSPDSRSVSVRKVLLGAESYETFKQALDEALPSKAK
ncbi:MAG TPA: DsbA family protein [Pyrinomonadaceae bacterium]|jgi:protein-disulfide isomerase